MDSQRGPRTLYRVEVAPGKEVHEARTAVDLRRILHALRARYGPRVRLLIRESFVTAEDDKGQEP
jgi:hypothetical protein